MADIEGLLHEVADAVISCKKEKVLEAVEKAKAELPPEEMVAQLMNSFVC